MLSSVYYKPPDLFVRKIRDRINERLDLEENDYDGQQEEYEDSMGVKKSEYIKDSQEQAGNYTDLVQADEQDGGHVDDLLGGSGAPQ